MRTWMRAVLALSALAMTAEAASAQEPQRDPAVAVAERFMRLMRETKWDSAGAMVSAAVPGGRMGTSQLETIWGQVQGQLGALSGVTVRGVTPADTMKAVDLLGDFAVQDILIRVVITPSGEVAGFMFLPAPAAEGSGVSAPYIERAKFREQEVVIGAAPWKLPGTLTVPVAPGRHPVVVLVHGSGPNDRDETVGANKPFRDLAWGLASQGVAVLRYEKRTREHMHSFPPGATVEQETIEDALAALQLARGHEAVDPARVYLLGHSLGGLVGPEIAQRDGRLAGLILMAAPARDIITIVVEQLSYVASLPLNAGEAQQRPLRDMQTDIKRLLVPDLADTVVVMGARASYWRDLARRQPVTVAQQLGIPLLVLHGERDYQVPVTDHRLWADALRGKPNATVQLFPGLNHLFMTGTGVPSPADYAQAGYVSAEVVSAIRAWIRR